jgi:hypothetical protein
LNVAYLLVVIVLAALVYIGWRWVKAQDDRSSTRVIGPDDDPDFLWRLNRGDNNPR